MATLEAKVHNSLWLNTYGEIPFKKNFFLNGLCLFYDYQFLLGIRLVFRKITGRPTTEVPIHILIYIFHCAHLPITFPVS